MKLIFFIFSNVSKRKKFKYVVSQQRLILYPTDLLVNFNNNKSTIIINLFCRSELSKLFSKRAKFDHVEASAGQHSYTTFSRLA